MLLLLTSLWLLASVDSLTSETHRLNSVLTSPCWGKAYGLCTCLDICVTFGHTYPWDKDGQNQDLFTP